MRAWTILLVAAALAFGDAVVAAPAAGKAQDERNATLTAQEILLEKRKTIESDRDKLKEINSELSKESIWQKSYSSHVAYLEVKQELATLQKRIAKLSKYGVSAEERNELDDLLAKEKILTDQINLLKGHKSPFANLLQPEEIEEFAEISNPFEIFTGVSFIKRLNGSFSEYEKRGNELRQIIGLMRKKQKTLQELAALEPTANYTDELKEASRRLDKFQAAIETLDATANVYEKRIEELELQINKQIKTQVYKLFNIGIIILVLFGVFFLMKIMAKRYITDNERFYMANKIITFANVTLIILIILFNYIENVNYIVTVLGFASAGIAIAMKDWFMSMLGWLVIVIGGSIHVGDRVKFVKEGMEYVGDVLDISLLRITILEDITLTTYMVNRRAGRVVFVPNNYIFTEMIANYSHASLKTVWDGIDFTISFDSNHKKAMHIAKETARKYAKGYTDITRKQLNKLRSRYNLKNTNVEPRVFSFIEENGIRISIWYLTNAYATLTLRSVISTDIIDAIHHEEDITIAYPTQKLYLSKNERKEPPFAPETELS
jgi:small-conductance mechanosensitive channel